MQSLHRVRDRLIGERTRAPGHIARARVTALLAPRRKFEPRLAALLDGGSGQSAQSEAKLEGLIQLRPVRLGISARLRWVPRDRRSAPSTAGSRAAVSIPAFPATAPVISSTVSPRTLRAIRNPPICDGVTSPESIESKALSASVRVSVAPAATLAIRGLNDSMTPFRVPLGNPDDADERRPPGPRNCVRFVVRARWRCSPDGTAPRTPGGRDAQRP